MFGHGGVVGDYDDGATVIVGEGAEDLDYVFGVGRVKVSRRLVGEDDLAALGESSCDRHALLLAAREERGKAIVVVCGEFDPLADLRSQSHSLFLGHSLQIERVAYVFLHGQKREEVVILIDHADGIAAEAVAVPILC